MLVANTYFHTRAKENFGQSANTVHLRPCRNKDDYETVTSKCLQHPFLAGYLSVKSQNLLLDKIENLRIYF